MKNIEKQEARLHDELIAARMTESENDIELHLSGQPVKGHSVAAKFLGDLLSKIQVLAEQITFALKHPSLIGEKIPRRMSVESEMTVIGFAPTSFTVKLRLPSLENIKEVSAAERRNKVFQSLHELFDDNSSEGDVSDLLIRYDIKDPYRQLLEVISDDEAELRVRTKTNPYGVTITAEQARKRVKWMNRASKEKENLELTGVLTGGSITNKNFQIMVGDITYRGPVSRNAHEQMTSFKFGEPVRAILEVTTRHRDQSQSSPSISYRLISIFKLSG